MAIRPATGAAPARARRSRRRSVAVGVSLLLAAVLAGCGSDDAEVAAGPGPAPTLAPATFEGEAVTVDGAPFDLAELAGNDLVVWFWAPW